MPYESSDGVDVTLDGAILRFTLDRPKRKNALDDGMTTAIVRQLEEAQNDEAVRCIVLAGAGDDFCSGFDIVSRNETAEGRPRVGAIQRRLPFLSHRIIPLLLDLQIPVVAAVRGWAAGIGLHLALAADFAVVADDAKLWEPFSTRGFTPDSGGTWLVPRLVGVARAKELLMLGRQLSGTEAAEWGLVHRAVPGGDVAGAADELATRLASGPTVTLGLTKWLVHRGTARVFDEHLADEAFAMELSSRTEDFREGLAALREKRDPGFTGR